MNKPQLEKWQRLDRAFPNKPKIDDKTVDRLVKDMREEFFNPEYMYGDACFTGGHRGTMILSRDGDIKVQRINHK
ncbi:hypothetical protein [Pediococcus acidilactici]|uniref:hypothetical protein n=1 Tax=Pediococcus acidilactici TaxID=1254 RepID=UPI001311F17A|nr:hypothetical protein [Pediococcus acidilactici]KAF0342093.1 hypothetical protein GBO42_00735 [Pediococcus acidilactici]KAF0353948.1 hypothetical protein GBO46_00735 [Pediococcus acidilactici]KAF0357612.1 hypothetical protein GBO48_00735 [Pediococcus acidilactici]KAF0376469.1 hypothetical protein GBO57_00790 [Pediococcus acidilactici]KAF0377530.1 hypothetical protein GBO59_00735 [Pediococcus acidilactici]